MRRLRVAVHAVHAPLSEIADTATGLPAYNDYSCSMRIFIVRDKMPVIGQPVVFDSASANLGPTAPFSQAALMTNPRAAFVSAVTFYPMQVVMGSRNPQTLSRYEILEERLVHPMSNYSAGVQTPTAPNPTGWWNRSWRSMTHFDIDLRGMVTQWYDQGNVNAQLTNKLSLLIVADAFPTDGVAIKWYSDLEFYNVDS